MSENPPPTLLTLFPDFNNQNIALMEMEMESLSSTTIRTAEDQPPVSTALSLTPPHVDLSAASLCVQETPHQHQHQHQEPPPLLALPTLQEITITALSLFPSATTKHYLPTKNPKDLGNFPDLFEAASSFSLFLHPACLNIAPAPRKPIKNHPRDLLRNFAELNEAASSLSLSLSLPTKRKRLIIIGPRPKKPANSSQVQQVEERVPKKHKVDKTPTRELAVLGNQYWIHKRLSTSDVNLSSRLLLPKEEIIKYVLPVMDMESCKACQNRDGLRVKIWDLDTESKHELSLKQWKTGSFLLTSNWTTEFVRRRSLHEGDSIGMCWDSQNGRFLFHKFNARS